MLLCGIVGGADAVRRSRSQSLECALLLRSAQSTEPSQRSVTPVATPVRPRGAGGHNAAHGNRHARAAALTARRAGCVAVSAAASVDAVCYGACQLGSQRRWRTVISRSLWVYTCVEDA